MSMDRRIRSILIVGGGTAGWLAAAYLNRALGHKAEVTLIESSDVPVIGVGEATIPTLRATMQFIGIDEADWMRACNASFKLAIQYVNWAVGPSAQGSDIYYHPFLNRTDVDVSPFELSHSQVPGETFSSVHYWMAQAARGNAENYAYMASPVPALCDARRFARRDGAADLRYAYHVDAGLLGAYLRKLAIGRGVKHVIGHVATVRKDEQGYLRSVTTKDGHILEADLFVDCTGFRALLIHEALGEPFISDASYLPCDRAVAIQSRSKPEVDGIRAHTIAQAHSAGWSWNVPLYNRNGTGYVYAGAFLSPEQAEAELRAHLGNAGDGMDANHIKMRVGRSRRVWVKNCVAMGLAGLFIEPLESTSIFFTEFQLSNLVSFFPDRDFNEALSARYNEIIERTYLQILDFVVMHYKLTQREDTPFWRFIQHELPVRDSLTALLQEFKAGVLAPDYLGFRVFPSYSIVSILSGMRYYPEQTTPLLELVDDQRCQQRLAQIRKSTQHLLEVLPTHYEYLKALHETGKFPD